MVQVTNGFANVPGLFGSYWPPGVFSFTGAIAALINLERANTAAYDALKRFDRRDARVGPVMNMVAFTPADPTSPRDAGHRHADYLFNRLFLNGVVNGRRRRERERDDRAGGGRPARAQGRFHRRQLLLPRPCHRRRGAAVARDPGPRLSPLGLLSDPVHAPAPPCPTTCSELGSEIYPHGFRQVLETAGSYRLPVYVTENGIADADDDQRPAYLVDHLRQLRLAIRKATSTCAATSSGRWSTTSSGSMATLRSSASTRSTRAPFGARPGPARASTAESQSATRFRPAEHTSHPLVGTREIALRGRSR